MATQFAPGYMQDPNAPAGYAIKIPGTETVPTPGNFAPGQTTTYGSVNVQPSQVQHPATPTIPASVYQSMRASIASGAISPQQALATIQQSYPGAQVDTGTLYAPMSFQQNGQTMGLNPDGTIKNLGATTQSQTVTKAGISAPTTGFQAQSTGDPALDAVQAQIKALTEQLGASGQLPANLQITPDVTAKFLAWAHGVVDPQTQQLLTAKAADINGALQNYATQYETQKGQITQDFGTELATEQNTAGGAGTAFSGQRTLNENNMVNTTNRSLASLGANTAYNVGNTLRAGAAAVGSANAGQFNLPTLAGGQVSNVGGQRGSSSNANALDFGYNPSIYTVGNIPSSQETAVGAKAQDYQKQYYDLASANTTRSVGDLLGMITNKPAGY